MSLNTVSFLSPEFVLVTAALIVYLGGALVRSAKLWAPLTLLALGMAAAALWWCSGRAPQAAGGPVTSDMLAAYGRWLALAVGLILALIAYRPLPTGGTSEYLGSLLLIITGLMLTASASNLVLIFVGLELISIPTYIVLSLGRRDPACQEATTKYFFLSILASATMLYGFSFLYGTAGSTSLSVIQGKLSSPAGLPVGFESLVKIGLVLVIAGLCFRVTAVPFHFYAPDVYQGTIHASAALLSVLPKAAGLIVLVRIVLMAMPDMAHYAWKITWLLAVLTMTLGNVLALWQDNVRRLLAYSSIANAGYMLIGLTVGLTAPAESGPWNGIGAMWFFLCVYAAATIGAFGVLSYLGRHRQQVETVEELSGLGRERPGVAAILAVCLFSLTGLPPAGGLWGKLLVFGSALHIDAGGGPLRLWFIALAVIGVLNAAIAAYYYLRIISVMYFRAPLSTPRAEGGGGALFAAAVCAVVVVALGVYPAPLIRGCAQAAVRGPVVERTNAITLAPPAGHEDKP